MKEEDKLTSEQSPLASNDLLGCWIEGQPPLRRIVMLWTGAVMFGPFAFQSNAEREEMCASIQPTHHLIFPIATTKQPNG